MMNTRFGVEWNYPTWVEIGGVKFDMDDIVEVEYNPFEGGPCRTFLGRITEINPSGAGEWCHITLDTSTKYNSRKNRLSIYGIKSIKKVS